MAWSAITSRVTTLTDCGTSRSGVGVFVAVTLRTAVYPALRSATTRSDDSAWTESAAVGAVWASAEAAASTQSAPAADSSLISNICRVIENDSQSHPKLQVRQTQPLSWRGFQEGCVEGNRK